MAQSNSVIQKNAPIAHSSIWRNRNFVTLFLSDGMVGFGGRVYELALPLIIYELSKSSVAMGTMRAVEFLPNLLLALFIGVIVDRVNKKTFMQTAIVTQTVFLLILFALLFSGVHSLVPIYLVGFFFMLCNYSYNNSRNSIVKIVIPKPLLTSANAKFSFTSTLFVILGPTLTGLILMFSRLEWGLLLTAIALGIAACSTSFIVMPVQDPNVSPKRNSFFADLKEGWTSLRQNRRLWSLTMVVMVNNAIDGMFGAMVVFYCKDNLHLNNSILGVVFSAAGIGGLLGSFVVDSLRKKLSLGKVLGLSILCNVLAYGLMYLSSNEYMAGASLFIEGMFMTIFSVCVWTFRQESTPSHLIGRVNGITGSFFKLAMPFTIFGAGWVAALLTTKVVFMAAGIGCLLLFLVYLALPLWSMKEQSEVA